MATIGLCAYLVRVRRPRSKTWLVMKQDGEMDFFALAKRYFEECKSVPIRVNDSSGRNHVVTGRAFRVETLNCSKKDGVLCGVIICGDMGRASQIVDVESNVVTHKKTTGEADMPPYYFRLEVPDGDDTQAILILQRFGHSGLRTALGKHMARYFADLDGQLDIAPLTDHRLLNTYLKRGTLEEIKVISHKSTRDKGLLLKQSRVDGENLAEGTKLAVILSKKSGLGRAKSLLPFVNNPAGLKGLVEVHGLEDPEEVEVKLEYNGIPKTFKILHPPEVGIMLDVTNKVSYDSTTNHPRLGSIDREAKEWASLLRRQLNESTT